MSGKRFGKVAVLMGGPSAEREVSLKSGKAVLDALTRRGINVHGIDADRDMVRVLENGRYERVFIALHGRWGEDGVIQGTLEVLDLPYTGSGVLGSALGMDKVRSKQLWSAMEIKTPEFAVMEPGLDIEQMAARLGFPLFVKPAREGSSFGMSRVNTISELKAALDKAAKFDDRVLIERCIEGMELTTGILGEEELPLIRIETPREFYDYEAKYILDTTRYICPSGLDAAAEKKIQKLARRAFDAIGCQGWGRVDFMMDKQGIPYVLEVNTVPGMTDHSLVPKAAKQAGIDFDELAVRILESSDVSR